MKVDLTARSEVERKVQAEFSGNQTVISLARPVAVLNSETSITRAIEVLRHSNLDAYPVINGSWFIFLLTESMLSNALLKLTDEEKDRYRTLTLGDVINPTVEEIKLPTVLNTTSSLSQAVEVFRNEKDTGLIVILDQSGFYHGILSRGDVLALTFKTLAPARVGGMATPLGVYLTDGVEFGGAGNFALMLSGAALTAMFAAAVVVLSWFNHIAIEHHIDVWISARTLLVPVMPGAYGFIEELQAVAPLGLMLLFLRAAPIAGYHAAEHQVVHCIERGEPLIYEKVSLMPRPHPRCGTNLVAAVTLFGFYFSLFGSLLGDPPAAAAPAAILTLLTWRQVGTFLQQFVTTRKASRKQIASGIAAGEDLLSKYRQNTNRQVKLPMRIWRMGFVQMFGGVAIFIGLLWLLSTFIPGLQPILQGIY